MREGLTFGAAFDTECKGYKFIVQVGWGSRPASSRKQTRQSAYRLVRMRTPHTCDQEPPHSKVLLVCRAADVPLDREDVSQYKLFRSRTAPRTIVLLRLDILLNLLSLRRGMYVSRISPAAAAAPLGLPELTPSLGTAVPRTPCYGRSRARQPRITGTSGGPTPLKTLQILHAVSSDSQRSARAAGVHVVTLDLSTSGPRGPPNREPRE